MANENAQVLLHGRECPFGYRCLAVDCLECMEINMEKGEVSRENEH